jgi:3-methylcrotonyl-CoA carboxylase beta subunit
VAVLSSTIDPQSEDVRSNAALWRELADDLRAKRDAVALGGPPKARERHLSRGKLLPRERVTRLLDLGSPFL